MSVDNEEEARRAKGLGEEALRRGDFDAAVRLLKISLRLREHPETQERLSAALAGQARQRGNAAQREAEARHPDMQTRLAQWSDWLRTTLQLDRHLSFALPSMRVPLALLAALILLLLVYRFVVGRGPLFTPGALPGDVYMQSESGNFFFSMPIVSSLLLSGVVNLVIWVWRSTSTNRNR